MSKSPSVLGLTLVLAMGQAASAEAPQVPSQTVQEQSKADSLLLGEFQQLVREWTLRCTAIEATEDANTSGCWHDAASALTPYTESASKSLVRQVEQLQAGWLERAAQGPSPAIHPPEKHDSAAQTVHTKPAQPTGAVPQNKPSQKTAAIKAVPAAQKSKAKLASGPAAKHNTQREKRALQGTERREVKVGAAAVQSPVKPTQLVTTLRVKPRLAGKRSEKSANEIRCLRWLCTASRKRK